MMSGSSLSLGTDDTCESHDRLPPRKVAPPKPKRSSWAGTVEKEDLKDATSSSPLELLKVTIVLPMHPWLFCDGLFPLWYTVPHRSVSVLYVFRGPRWPYGETQRCVILASACRMVYWRRACTSTWSDPKVLLARRDCSRTTASYRWILILLYIEQSVNVKKKQSCAVCTADQHIIQERLHWLVCTQRNLTYLPPCWLTSWV